MEPLRHRRDVFSMNAAARWRGARRERLALPLQGPWSPVDLHTGVSRVGERLAAVGNALRGANAAAPVRSRVRARMAFEHHALAKL